MKLLAASAAALSLFAMTGSQAMPVAAPLARSAASGAAIPVFDDCGPGWHRTPG